MSFAERVRQISDYIHTDHKTIVEELTYACLKELFAMLEKEVIDELLFNKESMLNIFFEANEDTIYCSTYNRNTVDRRGATELICKPIPVRKEYDISFKKHNRKLIAESMERICNEMVGEYFSGVIAKINYQGFLEIHYHLSL